MDDPWGSPWADEAVHTLPAKPIDDPTPKTSAQVQASSFALQEHTDSPWDDNDDNEFGEWSTGIEQNEDGQVHDSGAIDFDSGATTSVEKRSSTGPALSSLLPSWTDTTDYSPADSLGLELNAARESIENTRQVSPDPWATFESKSLPLEIDQSAGNSAISIGEPLNHTDKKYAITNSSDTHAESSKIDPQNEHEFEIEAVTQDADKNQAVDQSLHISVPAKDSELLPDSVTGSQNTDHTSSRPSSSPSPSEQSHHDETLHDSPRTSLDEEPKRMQEDRRDSSLNVLAESLESLSRKPGVDSGSKQTKGTELVLEEKKEELAETSKESEKGEEENEDSLKRNEKNDERGEEDDDFGGFEDFQEPDEEVISVPDHEEPIEESDLNDEVPKPSDNVGTRPNTASSTSSQPTGPITEPPLRRLDPVEFTVDITILEKLFPDAKPTSTDSEKLYISDTVPTDSFSSIEERKVWARISRYGTMRKHDRGDDDNYIRVNWSQSQVREDTMKIVTRWMDEDRIGGRVILGGMGKGSSGFGWGDTKTAPLSIAAAFAAKHSKKKPDLRRSPGSLLIPSPLSENGVSDHSGSETQSPASMGIPSPMAPFPAVSLGSGLTPPSSFGWDTHPTAMMQVPQTQSGSSQKNSPVLSSFQLTPAPTSKSHPTAPKATVQQDISIPSIPSSFTTDSHIKTQSVTVSAPEDIDDEEDDWGDMVSSPALEPSHSFPSLSSTVLQPSPILSPPISTSIPLPPIAKPRVTFQESPRSPITAFSNSMPTAFSPSISRAFETDTPPTTFAPSSDPWASADFSFFDMQATTSPKPEPQHSSIFSMPAEVAAMDSKPLPFSSLQSPGLSGIPGTPSIPSTSSLPAMASIPSTPTMPGISSIPNIPKRSSIHGIPGPPSVPISTPQTPDTHKRLSQSSQQQGGETAAIKQEKIARQIISNLPDLSYMLRR